MQKFILAVSPDSKLLMQTQAHLQEGGRFSVMCVKSGKEALSSMGTQKFDLAILDGEISDLPFVSLTRELVALSPNLKLLVFPPQNNPRHPVLNGLIANAFVSKPFFGPEVSEKISQVLNERSSSIPQSRPEEVYMTSTWVKNPEVGAQQTEQMLASTTASAGLLLLRGQVLFSSGVLPEESRSNIINYLNRYWMNIQSGELFRYLTMEHEASSYLIYAAPLIKETAIALVYQAQKPLQDVRTEVSRLRKAFLERYTSTRELREDFPPQTEDQTVAVPPNQSPSTSRMNTHRFSETPPVAVPLEDEEDQEGLSEKELQNLSNILAEMPAPDPDGTAPESSEVSFEKTGPWVPAETPFNSQPEPTLVPETAKPVFAEEELSYLETPPESTATPTLESMPAHEKGGNFPDFDFKLPWEEQPMAETQYGAAAFVSPPPLPVKTANDDTHPFVSTGVVPPPLSSQAILLPFTFLLFPADSAQFITRDLAALCNQRLPLILKSYGWQLKAISVRPLYLQWSALIPPFCSVPDKLSDIRLQLNTLFFSTYPTLLKNNPDGDFWLPGYFALSGSQPPSNRMINDFITLFRQVEPQLRPN
jgi:CheY-like chemotaxis protein